MIHKSILKYSFDDGVNTLIELVESYDLEHKNDYIEVYRNAYYIIKHIEEQNKNAYNIEEFKKLLSGSSLLFSTIFSIKQDNTNLKCVKNIDKLTLELAKYIKYENISEETEKIFNELTNYKTPNLNNALTLTKINFSKLIKSKYMNRNESNEIALIFLRDLFDKQRFRSDLRIKEIRYKQYFLKK